MQINWKDKRKPIEARSHAERNLKDAYESVRKEVEGFPSSKIVPITADIAVMMSTIAGGERRWKEHLDEMRRLATLDIKAVKKCVSYAQATGWLDLLFKEENEASDIPALVEKVTAFKTDFLQDLVGPANRGLIDGSRFNELRGTTGQLALGYDTLYVCTIVRTNWSALDGCVSITLKEVDEAEKTAQDLVDAVGYRDHGSPEVSRLSVLRQNAFSLTAYAYDEVRSAIAFLRRHQGDLESIAPTFYVGRGPAKKETSDTGSATAETGAAGATATTGATGSNGAAASPVTSTTASTTSAPAPAVGNPLITPNAATGLPGMGPSTPFSK